MTDPTILDYFNKSFLADAAEGSTIRCVAAEILNEPSGAGDGSTHGSILAEMPELSGCGADCCDAIDKAVGFHAMIRMAYGDDRPDHTRGLLAAVIDVCCCFIRG